MAGAPGIVTSGTGPPNAVVQVQPGMNVQPVVLVDQNGNYLTGSGSAATAGYLADLTGTVNVSAATAPTAGQVLTATGGSAATWQTNPAGFANPMTTGGDLIFESGAPAPARLAGNAGSAKTFLTSTGTGGTANAPVWGTITTTDVPFAALLAGAAFTGEVTVQTPVNASDAVTKAYADAIAQGLSVKPSVQEATAAALPANVYGNGSSGVGATLTGLATGTLTVDGILVALNDRVLVKNEAAAANNGIYTCTVAGALGVAYVLTRATDMNTAAQVPGAFCFTEQGTVNVGAGFTVASEGPFVIGTTAINWTQFSGAGEITAGTGLSKTGNTIGLMIPVTVADGGTGGTTATLAFGNLSPMTTLGDTLYENATPAVARLAGNTTSTKEFLTSTGIGGTAQAPAWSALASGDIPNNAANTSGSALTAGTAAAANALNSATTEIAVSGATAPSAGQVLTASSGTVATWSFGLTSVMTTGGDMIFEAGGAVPARLAGNTASTRNFLTSTGSGGTANAPAWGTIAPGDVPQLADYAPTGLTGATAASRYVGGNTSGPPVSGTFAAGDIAGDQSGAVQVCTAAGTPGTWASTAFNPQALLWGSSTIASTAPPFIYTSVTYTPVSGVLNVTAIILPAGYPVNDITFWTNATAAGGVTHGWYAILDSGGTVRAVTADQGTTVTVWHNTKAPYKLPTTATWTPATTGLYYAGVMIAAGTMPTLVVAGDPFSNGINASGAPVMYGSGGTAWTTPPAAGSALTVSASGTDPMLAQVSSS